MRSQELAARDLDRGECQPLLGVLDEPGLQDGAMLRELVGVAGDHEEPAREPDDLRTSPKSGLPFSTRAPAERKTVTARSKTPRTSSSIVIRPLRSGVHAIRQPFTDGARTVRVNSPVSTSYESGERSSAPAMAASISAASATVRAIGPSTEYVSHASTDG